MNQTEQNIGIASDEEIQKAIWNLLESVTDPEIPVLSILDLGIVRDVKIAKEIIQVVITPTYSGCPAMDLIGMNIQKVLTENGFDRINITHQLSPAWTTDWMTEEGKGKLKSYGIAPPASKTFDLDYLKSLPVSCPHCNSINTRVISQFGSTACKALYQCEDCSEPFDYFKCH